MAGSGDELAARAGDRSRLRASDADREQVATVLKVAFMQGRLTKEEFDLRVGQVLASRTYADLDALTADIPVGLTKAQRAEPVPEPNSSTLIRRGTAMGAGAVAVFTIIGLVTGSAPAAVFIIVPVFTLIATVLMAGFLGLRNQPGVCCRLVTVRVVGACGYDVFLLVPRVQAVRTRRRWFAGLRKP